MERREHVEAIRELVHGESEVFLGVIALAQPGAGGRGMWELEGVACGPLGEDLLPLAAHVDVGARTFSNCQVAIRTRS